MGLPGRRSLSPRVSPSRPRFKVWNRPLEKKYGLVLVLFRKKIHLIKKYIFELKTFHFNQNNPFRLRCGIASETWLRIPRKIIIIIIIIIILKIININITVMIYFRSLHRYLGASWSLSSTLI